MKIAILTNFHDFPPGYSLTGIVYDQSLMLARYGHDVHLFVNEQFSPKGMDFAHVTIHKKVPFAHLKDYSSAKDLTPDHLETIEKMRDMLVKELSDFDFAYTHDFIFTGWFLPYGLGCIEAGHFLPHLQWMHWIHSVPSSMRDWWQVRTYGPTHKLIFPNETDRLRVAEQYRGAIEDVRVIPHIKDARTWFEFHDDTKKLIDLMPATMSAHVMQVYPAGSDRLAAKGVDKVIQIFGEIKRRGAPVCLLIANQWATGRQRKQCIEPFEAIAKAVGLLPGVDFAFTSDLALEWHNGLPRHMVRELFQLSNLFIFPTREESFGLVVPEAALSGGCLLVLNKSLDMQAEITDHTCLYFDFGSFSRNHKIDDEEKYYSDLAVIILGRMNQNEGIKTKTFCRMQYNMDNLYRQYYEPIMAELGAA